MICVKGHQSPARMIDIGAGRNLIKQNAVNPKLPIDEKIMLKITGINNLPLFTMGQVQINILGYPTILNIIPNEIPINEDGVLGSELFWENKVNTNYISKCLEIQNKLYPFESTQISTIPVRTVTTFYIITENSGKSEGYIPRLHIGEGIYAGDAIVKNCKGKARIKFANTNEIQVTISIPTITLEDFEERESQNVTRESRYLKNSSDNDLSNKILNSFLRTDSFFDNPCNFFNITGEERIECIKKLLRLEDHLNH